MDYRHTIDYLFTQTPVFQRDGASAYKPGLETALILASAFGDPQNAYNTIHVAGTNGKGSTAHTLAAVFQSAGLRTGLYTSPHLTDFRERIRVNGEMITEDAVVDFVARYLDRPDLTDRHPSFFELTTIMAFEWFAKMKVDVAVIEVGLGGRLDTTNIIHPALSIITNISLDHTGLLGDTPEDIATEKAGIIKPGVPVVIGEADDQDVLSVFQRRADEVGAALYVADPVQVSKKKDGCWLYNGRIHGELKGDFQPRNAATVLTALRVLDWPEITGEAIEHGFANVEELTGLRGRLSTLQGRKCKVIYDTGHNPGAWKYIAPFLASIKAPRKIFVIGFAADKDVDSILAKLPDDAEYIFTRPTGNRGMAADELMRMAVEKHHLSGRCVPSVHDAFILAESMAGSDGFIFVGGSNFVVADLLRSIS